MQRGKRKKVDNRKKRRYVNKDEYVRSLGKGPTIVVDCDYDSTQSERNVRSLVVQLSLSYSCIRRSETPCKLIVCGISSRLYEGLVKTLANNWAGVELLGCDLEELVSARFGSGKGEGGERYKVTYLTADSDNVLQYGERIRYDDKHVFIVGGMVDRNRYKNASKTRAEDLNIDTARLPIRESGVSLNSNVLTINHVIECMVRYNESADWSEVFGSILPKRKVESA